MWKRKSWPSNSIPKKDEDTEPSEIECNINGDDEWVRNINEGNVKNVESDGGGTGESCEGCCGVGLRAITSRKSEGDENDES